MTDKKEVRKLTRLTRCEGGYFNGHPDLTYTSIPLAPNHEYVEEYERFLVRITESESYCFEDVIIYSNTAARYADWMLENLASDWMLENLTS